MSTAIAEVSVPHKTRNFFSFRVNARTENIHSNAKPKAKEKKKVRTNIFVLVLLLLYSVKKEEKEVNFVTSDFHLPRQSDKCQRKKTNLFDSTFDQKKKNYQSEEKYKSKFVFFLDFSIGFFELG